MGWADRISEQGSDPEPRLIQGGESRRLLQRQFGFAHPQAIGIV